MTRKKVYNILVFLLAGTIIGLVFKYYKSFTFDFEISVFDVFALIVTVFLAWWVAEKLEKDTAVERCEKDILIEKIRLMEELIEKIKQKAIEAELVQLSDVNALINQFDVLSPRVAGSIEERYADLFSSNSKENDYRDDMEELDNLCTNDKIETMPNSMVMEERDGKSVCIYNDERRDEIEAKASKLSDKLFNLQLLLNRA